MRYPYPATFDVVDHPAQFDRPQLVLRFVLSAILGMLGISIGLVFGVVYFLLPAATAMLVSSGGRERFAVDGAVRLTRWLRWLLAVSAYFALLTDRFPTEHPEEIVRFDVTPASVPTVGSALLRLLATLPALIVLAVLWIPGFFAWFIAAISILFVRHYPEGLARFLFGIQRYQARILAYHASLVDRYPAPDFDAAEPSNVTA